MNTIVRDSTGEEKLSSSRDTRRGLPSQQPLHSLRLLWTCASREFGQGVFLGGLAGCRNLSGNRQDRTQCLPHEQLLHNVPRCSLGDKRWWWGDLHLGWDVFC